MKESPLRPWRPSATGTGEQVETFALRAGMSLILSHFDAGAARCFRFVEPADMFGLGFHLKGGSRFDVERSRFETRPLEVWAGAAPRGAVSSFVLPTHGFRTVSLRFSPAALAELLERHGPDARELAALARSATEAVSLVRLSSLDPTACRRLEAMFTTPYTGAARTLFLEACALELLAAQIEATTRSTNAADAYVDRRLRKKALAARDYLDSHFVEPPTIASLARIAGTNEFSLKRAFKRAFGVTIFGYVQQRRMALALAELEAGRSVGATARAAGYECPRSFANAFRRHFGALPSTIAAELRAGIPDHHG